MDLISDAAALVIGISAILVFYTAVLHITRIKSAVSYRFRIIRDLILGVVTLQLFFITRGMQFNYPFLLYPLITLLFISAPFNYMRYSMFLYPVGKVPLLIRLQLIPAAAVLALETWFYFISGLDSKAVMCTIFNNPMEQPITILIAFAMLVMLVQYMLVLRLELGYVKNNKARGPVHFSVFLTIMYILDTLAIATGFLISNSAALNSGILLIGVTGITFLIFENRYPHFYQLVAREERQQKYKRSLIQGLNKEKIISRLQELMEDEKIYQQYELKLDAVAAMLLVTPHQLSEFINDYLGMNFSGYVNTYRVKEAKELLIRNPERSILSIGMEVGFGSKQSFNKIFKQNTGITPSEYRKRV